MSLHRGGSLLAAAAFLVYLWAVAATGFVPTGAVGQPRATSLPALWTMPVELVGYLSGVGVLLVVGCFRPLWGLAATISLSFAFPVHSPEWIFIRAMGFREVAAIAIWLSATAYSHQKPAIPKLPMLSRWNSTTPYWLAGFVAWCLVSSLVAAFRPEGFHPALQFHPLQLLQGALLFAAVLQLADPLRSLTAIAVAVIATLAVRYVLFRFAVRDAGIATDVVLAFPLAGYLLASSRTWAMRVFWGGVMAAATWLLIEVQNRGAVVALLASSIAVLATWQRRKLALGTFVGIVGVAVMLLRDSPVGDRFQALIDNGATLWESNSRVQVWRGGFEMAWEHPLVGVGPGNFVHWIGWYAPDFTWRSAHNIVVDVAAESGFVGLALFVGLVGSVLISGWRQAEVGNQAGRWVLVAMIGWLTAGCFLTTTMFVLPYVLMAIPAHGSSPRSDG